jgi:hypothetical protein
MTPTFKDEKWLYPGQYGWVLRAIGQDLANLCPETFELRTDGVLLVVRGHSRSQSHRFKGSLRRNSSRLKHAHANPIADRMTPSQLKFVRTYTLDDIRRLDRVGVSRRSGLTSANPDQHSLAERLRTIGMTLDLRAGRLLMLRKDKNSVTFEYEDSGGKTHIQDDSLLNSWRDQQRFHSERKDPWERAR